MRLNITLYLYCLSTLLSFFPSLVFYFLIRVTWSFLSLLIVTVSLLVFFHLFICYFPALFLPSSFPFLNVSLYSSNFIQFQPLLTFLPLILFVSFKIPLLFFLYYIYYFYTFLLLYWHVLKIQIFSDVMSSRLLHICQRIEGSHLRFSQKRFSCTGCLPVTHFCPTVDPEDGGIRFHEETSGLIYKWTRSNIPKDLNLQHRYEKFKASVIFPFFLP